MPIEWSHTAELRRVMGERRGRRPQWELCRCDANLPVMIFTVEQSGVNRAMMEMARRAQGDAGRYIWCGGIV